MEKLISENVFPTNAEIIQSVEVLFNELLYFHPGENLLLYVDEGSDLRVAHLIKKRVEDRGGQAKILQLSKTVVLDKQVLEICNTIKNGSFQIMCELSEQYFYLTQAWRIALEAGIRVYSLAGLDSASFVRCVGKVNHSAMFKFGQELKKILQKAHHLHINSQNGTDIKMQMGSISRIARFSGKRLYRLITRFCKKNQSFIGDPSGILDGKTRATFLGGQVSFRGIPQTIEGIAVIDGYMWPPDEIGSLENPLVLKIKKGSIVEISGCPEKSHLLKKRFYGQLIEIEHLCIGFNPGAKLPSKILEAERVFGSISIGIGKGSFHTDGVIKNPSLKVNNTWIAENGAFISPQLSSFIPHSYSPAPAPLKKTDV